MTLINNIAPAHIEGFGSIDGVARAKGEIHQGLSLRGTAVSMMMMLMLIFGMNTV